MGNTQTKESEELCLKNLKQSLYEKGYIQLTEIVDLKRVLNDKIFFQRIHINFDITEDTFELFSSNWENARMKSRYTLQDIYYLSLKRAKNIERKELEKYRIYINSFTH